MPALAELSTGQPSDWEAEGESKWGFLNEPRVDVEASQTAMIHCRGESSGAERSGESKGRGQITLQLDTFRTQKGGEHPRDSLQKGGVVRRVGGSKAGFQFYFCCFVILISLSNTPINVCLCV